MLKKTQPVHETPNTTLTVAIWKSCTYRYRPRMMTIMQLDQEQLDEIYTFAVDLGRKAGQLLLDSIERRIAGEGSQSVEEKENAVDIVTQTDEGSSLALFSR